ncbi:MAG TPA: hypothetical protein VIL74_25260 [Pyrinomonadaceae bacterium]|jgi:hypothetical protein
MQKLNRLALVFAVGLLTLTPALALSNKNHVFRANNSSKKSFAPSAVFKSCWIDYNVTDGGRKGMRIHVNFEVTGLKGVDAKLVARVQTDDGEFLTNNSSYSNDEGHLETSFSIKPGYATTVYEDADMFLPYNEIGLRKGVWNLKLDIDLSYEDGELIKHLTTKEFEYTSAGGNDAPTKNAGSGATVKKVWIDYNVTEGGRKGMRVHVSFEVKDLKGVDAKVVARVQKENEDFLTNTNPAYSNGNDELEISYDIKPGYPVTVYEDATLFLPYGEIVIRKGVWNLKLDIDLNYENGELIQHLDYYDFEFTR